MEEDLDYSDVFLPEEADYSSAFNEPMSVDQLAFLLANTPPTTQPSEEIIAAATQDDALLHPLRRRVRRTPRMQQGYSLGMIDRFTGRFVPLIERPDIYRPIDINITPYRGVGI